MYKLVQAVPKLMYSQTFWTLQLIDSEYMYVLLMLCVSPKSIQLCIIKLVGDLGSIQYLCDMGMCEIEGGE